MNPLLEHLTLGCESLPSLSSVDNQEYYQEDSATPHINLHALVSNATTETLLSSGTIKNKDIITLVDGGSIRDFI